MDAVPSRRIGFPRVESTMFCRRDEERVLRFFSKLQGLGDRLGLRNARAKQAGISSWPI